MRRSVRALMVTTWMVTVIALAAVEPVPGVSSPGLADLPECYYHLNLIPGPDFDGDCDVDVAVGAPHWDGPSVPNAGAVRIVENVEHGPVVKMFNAASLGFPLRREEQFGA